MLLPATGIIGVGEQDLVWFSSGFEPGRVERLDISITRLDGGATAATVAPRPDAVVTERGDLVTGIDLPEAGCWEVTGEFDGQRLNFVIQSIER